LTALDPLTALYPLKLPASLRPKIWGSRDLSPVFSAQPEPIGEAWFSFEENPIANGPFAGQTLGELVEHLGRHLMGSSYRPSGLRRRAAGEIGHNKKQHTQFYFPILSKLLFTSENLSVQVHPDDAYAMAREDGPGKTEMWHIVDARPGAKLVLGLTRTMAPVELCRAAASGDIEKSLNWVPVEKGQTFFISPGTLHTIGAGIVLCEIQQNSDLTYRFYDFGRLGSDGKPRDLHIEQGAAVTRQQPHPGALPLFHFPGPAPEEGLQRELLAACRYFAAERLSWSGAVAYDPDPERFHLLIFLEGRGVLAGDSWGKAGYQPGDAYLIPAECSAFELQAASSPSRAIRSYVPDLAKLRQELQSTGAPSEQFEHLLTD
jgi:mannose-6-phosphate isomerase